MAERVKVTGIDLGFEPTDKPDIFKEAGTSRLFKHIDGEWFECFPSGYLRDAETPRHIVSYGKVHRKPNISKRREAEREEKLDAYMMECFPESYPYTRQGLYPVYERTGRSRRLLSVEEVAEWRAERQSKYAHRKKAQSQKREES